MEEQAFIEIILPIFDKIITFANFRGQHPFVETFHGNIQSIVKNKFRSLAGKFNGFPDVKLLLECIQFGFDQRKHCFLDSTNSHIRYTCNLMDGILSSYRKPGSKEFNQLLKSYCLKIKKQYLIYLSKSQLPVELKNHVIEFAFGK